MNFPTNRRAALCAGASLAAAAMMPAWAQAQPTLRFAAVFSDKDIRADMMKMLAKDIEADFASMNDVWSAWLSPGQAPSRTTLQAQLARPQVLVEITVIAARR